MRTRSGLVKTGDARVNLPHPEQNRVQIVPCDSYLPDLYGLAIIFINRASPRRDA
jgi:hypothetical protein